MLKRHQVLLNEWQVEFLKKYADEKNISFSEVIRIFIALSMASGHRLTIEKSKEGTRKNISDLMFNARKATEVLRPGVPVGAGAPVLG